VKNSDIMTEIKKAIPEGIEFDEEGFRQATPPEIADYKAKRLSNVSIADLGSGIGIQAIFFSRYFKHVVAIEKDKTRYRFIERNIKKLGINNVSLYHGDVFTTKLYNEISSCEIIFSDPSRPVKGKEWALEMLSPSPLQIISYFKSNEKFSFDIPVQISRERIPEDYEMEYISLDGEIKRLSIYSPALKKFERSALLLPEGDRIEYNPNISREINSSDFPMHYLYEIDPAISYADLIPEFFSLFKNMYMFINERKRVISTSENFYRDPRMKNIYVVSFKANSVKKVRENLKKNSARKVFLRYNVNSFDYYRIKKDLEKDLDGDNDFYIFKKGEEFIGAIKLRV